MTVGPVAHQTRGSVSAAASPRSVAKLYFVFAAVTVIFLNFVVPPLSAPDEFPHLYRAGQISAGHILPVQGPDGTIGGYIDASVEKLFRILRPVAGWPVATPMADGAAARQLGWSGVPVLTTFQNTGQYGPILYLPQAAGLLVGRAVGLSVVQSYCIARLLAAFTAIVIATLAIANAGRGAFVAAVVMSTPMFLFLATSVSQDGLLVAVSALFAALVAQPASGTTQRRNWLAWGCALSMAMARPPYMLLAVLLLRRPDRQGLDRRRSIRWVLAPDGVFGPVAVCALAAAWLLAVGSQHQPGFSAEPNVDPPAQLHALLAHPVSILRVAGQTLSDGDRLAEIGHQAIGVLGALTIPIPMWGFRLGMAAILVAALACTAPAPGRSPLFSGVAAGVFLVSIGGLFGALYLTWTPVGKDVVEGFQGRYLLPYLVGLVLVVPPARAAGPYSAALHARAAACGYAAWAAMIWVACDAILLLYRVYGGVFTGAWWGPLGG